MTDVGTYLWAEDIDAACITIIDGHVVDRVRELFECDPRSERLQTFEQSIEAGAAAYPDSLCAAQIETLGGSTVVVEPNGYFGADTSRLSAVSVGGRAVCAYWSVNNSGRFFAAVDGTVVRTFDALMEDDQLGDPLPEEDGLPFFPDEEQLGDPATCPPLVAALLALLARLTSIQLTRVWLDAPRRTWTTETWLAPRWTGGSAPE